MPEHDKVDTTQRIRAVLGGQLAPASSHGGRQVIFRCSTCGYAWIMDGSQVIVRPTDEEIDTWVDRLGANLATLPYATCRLCAAQSLGELNIDAYHTPALPDIGFGISAELVEPTGAHLVCSVIRLDTLQSARTPPHIGPVTDFARCRAWLLWLSTVQAPLTGYHLLTPQDSTEMARLNAPGHSAPGTDKWLWRGAVWQGACPPLGGHCYCSFGQALPQRNHSVWQICLLSGMSSHRLF